jgi:hypothetical protein
MPLSWNEIKSRAIAFSREWTTRQLPAKGAETVIACQQFAYPWLNGSTMHVKLSNWRTKLMMYWRMKLAELAERVIQFRLYSKIQIMLETTWQSMASNGKRLKNG